jgi:hypothetical protein
LAGNLREIVVEDVIEALDVIIAVPQYAMARITPVVIEWRVEGVERNIEGEGNASMHQARGVDDNVVRDQI